MMDLDCRHGRRFRARPANTAVISIDLQRDFIDPAGYAATAGENVAALAPALDNAVAVLDAARRAGLTIVHTREGHRPDLSDLRAAKQDRSRAAGAPIGADGPLGRLLVRGEYGHDFVDAARPQNDEIVIDKPGYSAFFETTLADQLAARGIESLLIMGVTTQCCVFATLREAVDRGFYCATVENACAAFERRWHDATLELIASEGHLFGSIVTAQPLVDALETLG